jgi:hypothetical protein
VFSIERGAEGQRIGVLVAVLRTDAKCVSRKLRQVGLHVEAVARGVREVEWVFGRS